MKNYMRETDLQLDENKPGLHIQVTEALPDDDYSSTTQPSDFYLVKISKSALVFLMVAALFPIIGLAAQKDKERNPLGCKDVGYKFDLRALDLYPESVGDRHSLYFVHNITKKPLKLYQMRSEDSAHSVHLNHEIYPNRWAVLATSAKHLKYACAIDDGKSEYGNLVDCAKSVTVCEFAKVRYGMNNRGNYWMVKGNTRNGAVREVVWYGVIPQ